MEIIAIVLSIIALVQVSSVNRKLKSLLESKGISSKNHAYPLTDHVAKPFTHTPADTAAKAAADASQHVSTPLVPRETVSSLSSEELGGRWLAGIGVASVLIGVGFFLNYMYSHDLIPPAGRVAIAVIFGLIFLGVGQWLRKKYQSFSNVLMGTGISILYLSVFSAYALYNLISSPILAFVCVAAVTLLSVVISIVDDSKVLAVVSFIGAFVTPYLLEFGTHADYVPYFTYLLILDMAILAIAYWKKWHELTFFGFFFTGFSYYLWYTSSYRVEDLPGYFAFITLYFLLFLGASVVHHIARREKSDTADVAMLTINAVGYFGISYALLSAEFDGLMGFFAVAMALLYFVLAYIAYLTNREDRTMNMYLPGLSVVFLTIAIPLQFDGSWIVLGWFIESLVLLLISRPIKSRTLQVFSVITYILGFLKFLDTIGDFPGLAAFFNRQFLVALIAIVISYCIAAVLKEGMEGDETQHNMVVMAIIFFIFAQILTIITGTVEINRHYMNQSTERYAAFQTQNQQSANYGSIDSNETYGKAYTEFNVIEQQKKNEKDAVVSIFWTLYAVLLVIVGFARRSRLFRMLGLIFFFITAVKIFLIVWGLGQIERIIATIVFGVVALVGAFLYYKFKERIKDIL